MLSIDWVEIILRIVGFGFSCGGWSFSYNRYLLLSFYEVGRTTLSKVMRYSCSLNIFCIIVATIAKDDEGVSGKGVLWVLF